MTDSTSATGEHEEPKACPVCHHDFVVSSKMGEGWISCGVCHYHGPSSRPSPVDMTNLEKDINNRQYEYGILDTEHRLKADLASTVEKLLRDLHERIDGRGWNDITTGFYDVAESVIRAHFSETGE